MFRKLLAVGVVAAVAGSCAIAIAANLSGAGATFPAPVYAKWAESYKAQSGNALNYQAIGSGGGIKQIKAKTVDFGASDKPLKPDDLAAGGLLQFPTVVGGVVPVMNLPGIKPGEVRITGPILADIYRGIRKNWNDPVIASFNPGVKLPNLPITVVHRSGRLGHHLPVHQLSGHEGAALGRRTRGQRFGEAGRPASAARATTASPPSSSRRPGAIGYVEYAYAKQNRMTYAVMQNKAGKWVSPTAAAFAAAAAGAKWQAAPGFYLLLLDQPGAGAWPITGATFILMHAKQTNAQTGHDVLAFFDWAYKNGNGAAAALDYVPLPDAVKALVRKSWLKIVGPDGKPVYR